jgi:predicted small secreted protein
MAHAKTDLEPNRARTPVRAHQRRIVTLVLAAIAASFTLTACPEKKGPAEKAGEALDDAADGMKDAVTPDGPAEDLGEKLDEATN